MVFDFQVMLPGLRHCFNCQQMFNRIRHHLRHLKKAPRGTVSPNGETSLKLDVLILAKIKKIPSAPAIVAIGQYPDNITLQSLISPANSIFSCFSFRLLLQSCF